MGATTSLALLSFSPEEMSATAASRYSRVRSDNLPDRTLCGPALAIRQLAEGLTADDLLLVSSQVRAWAVAQSACV